MFKFLNKNKKKPSKTYSLADQSAKWETLVGMFPRPMTAQHLSSYSALREISANLSKTFGVFLLFCFNFPLSLIVLYFSFSVFSVFVSLKFIEGYEENGIYLFFFCFLAFLFPFISFLKDTYSLWRRYFGFSQSESHGASRYAFLAELKEKRLLWKWHPSQLQVKHSIIEQFETDDVELSKFYQILYKITKPIVNKGLPSDPLANGYLPIATFGFGRWICLPLALVARHMTFLGPPGSGKSASFFIQQARCFSRLGSAVILDLKGEIFRHSSFYYKKVFRIDFQRPETSDRFLLGSLCYKDALAAGEVADLIIGYDPNTQTGGNPFWDESASMLLKCLLLLLAEKNMHFTPADIFEFIANHQFDEANNIDRLAEVMNSSANPDIRNSFAPFAQLDGKTKSNILISMAAKLKAFQDTTVQIVLSPPTPEEAAKGCQIIDPALLRKKGTALYVVVPEGRASQLANVVGTLLGSVANILRRTGDTEDFRGFLDFHARRIARMKGENWSESEITKCYIEENDLSETIENPTYVLLQYDEAGNVPLRNLSEDIGVGRGRKMCYVLGYQNFDQPEKQYGASVARSILQSIGTKIALTGLTDKTSEYVVKLLGKTTSYEYSSSDAQDDRFDNFSKRETSRDLMSEAEIRTLPAYTQAILISTDIRPLRVGFPPVAKEIDSFEAVAPVYFNPLEKIKNLQIEAMKRIAESKEKELMGQMLALQSNQIETPQVGENLETAVEKTTTNDSSTITNFESFESNQSSNESKIESEIESETSSYTSYYQDMIKDKENKQIESENSDLNVKKVELEDEDDVLYPPGMQKPTLESADQFDTNSDETTNETVKVE